MSKRPHTLAAALFIFWLRYELPIAAGLVIAYLAAFVALLFAGVIQP